MKIINKIKDFIVKQSKNFDKSRTLKMSPSPVFWKGKDITGKYHDKKELNKSRKKIEKNNND